MEYYNNINDAPAGISILLSRKATDKEFFFRQDRAYHFANRRPDMTYLIYDEQLLDMERYLEKLREYMDFYKVTFLEGDLLQEEVPVSK